MVARSAPPAALSRDSKAPSVCSCERLFGWAIRFSMAGNVTAIAPPVGAKSPLFTGPSPTIYVAVTDGAESGLVQVVDPEPGELGDDLRGLARTRPRLGELRHGGASIGQPAVLE